MTVQVKFYYDVVSPWALIAFHVLKRYQQAWNIDITLKPVYLGGVMVSSGNRPPISVPNKGKWMTTSDIPLASQFYGVTLIRPPEFPVNTINNIRLLRILRDKEPPSVLAEVTEIFFTEIWGQSGAAAAQPANFASIIPSSVLSRAKLEEYINASQTPENKELVKAEATQLVAEGAFGFPYIVVTREDGALREFFGSDRFEMMAFWLGRKWDGPFPEDSGPRL